MNITVVVMDSVGVGALPDAKDFGDAGTNTIAGAARAGGGLKIPHLQRLGIANITEIPGVEPVEEPAGAFGKMAEQSAGKDTSAGHWELMGVVSQTPFAVFPNGFPAELIKKFEQRTGYPVIGNKVASGTEIIKELGEQQAREKALIVYTSADSVFQIAAHEEVFPVEEQMKIAKIARELCDEYGIIRVIARPYVGKHPDYKRTANRKDISVPPGDKTLVEYLSEQAVETVGIGKTASIFADRGFERSIKTKNNADGIGKTITEMQNHQPPAGKLGRFIFTNLVDFDSEFGHRRNPEGYARALEELDARIPDMEAALGEEDLLVFTADHGNDPTHTGTDHTREYIPLLVTGPGVPAGINLEIRESFADLAATLRDLFGIEAPDFGRSFAGVL